MKNLYQCEFCNQIFETVEKCQAHEAMEKTGISGMLSKIHIYDKDRKPIPLETDPAEYYYIYVESIEAAESLSKYIKEYMGNNYAKVYDPFTFLYYDKGLYMYDSFDETWTDVLAKYEEMEELMEYFQIFSER